MTLSCKPGDLALVIREEKGCEGNIGKLVRVAGPIKFNQRQQATWLIEPARQQPWRSVSPAGKARTRKVTFASRVEHPDEWLLPIDPDVWNLKEVAEETRYQGPQEQARGVIA